MDNKIAALAVVLAVVGGALGAWTVLSTEPLGKPPKNASAALRIEVWCVEPAEGVCRDVMLMLDGSEAARWPEVIPYPNTVEFITKVDWSGRSCTRVAAALAGGEGEIITLCDGTAPNVVMTVWN